MHAIPGARRNHVGGEHDGALKISVTAAPDKGRANKAIVQELAQALDVNASQIELLQGQTHRRKLFAVQACKQEIESKMNELKLRS